MKKNLFFLLVITVLGQFLYSEQFQKPDYIYNDQRIFEDAVICFENQNYGESLKLIEKAEASRKNKTEWEVFTLQNSFKPADVKMRGDSITEVIPILQERQDFDALEILDRYEKYFGYEKFDNSCKKLISFIKERKKFPEAEYLKGKIYQLEGEYKFAEEFFFQAYKDSSILDIPSEKYDILYSLADISFVQKNFKKYEEYLLLILSQDEAYKDLNLKRAMNNTISSTRPDCVEKFFLMYRSDNYRLLKAYFELSAYYLSKNEKQRALDCVALGCLTGFTKIYNTVQKRNPDFEYKGLTELLNEASTYPDIVEWGKDNEVWKGFNDFAQETFRNQCPIFSINLYNAIKLGSPEDYWRKDAEKQLKIVTGELKE